MDDLLPIIEGLRDATDDGARADMLLRMPLEILLKRELQIRAELERLKFQPGLDWLAIEISALRRTRSEYGELGFSTDRALLGARLSLAAVRHKRDRPDGRCAPATTGDAVSCSQ